MTRSLDNVQIRLAVPDEADAIAAILHTAFAEFASVYTPGALDATWLDSDRIRARMEEGPVWIALLDDIPVGTVAAVARPEGLYIRGMAILPSARGLRIGTMLLNQVEEFAAREDFTRLFLSTTSYLEQAIRLYERHGFQRNGEGPHDLFGTPLFTMEKRLEIAE